MVEVKRGFMKQIINQELPVTAQLQYNRVVCAILWVTAFLLFPLFAESQCVPETQNLVMCPGESTILDGQPTGSGTYAWHQWEILDPGTTQGVQFFNLSSQVLSIHTFNASLAPGTIILQYAYMDNTGCVGSKEVLLTVKSGAEIEVSPYSFACLEGGMVTLNAQPAGGTFTANLSGAITDLANGTALLDPAVVGLGEQVEITYSVTDGSGCSSEKSFSIEILTCLEPKAEQYGPCTPRENAPGSQGNASSLTDGQFEESIIITDLGGSNWKMIQCQGFFQSASPQPPLAPINFDLSTGDLELVEGPPGIFTLQGIHLDALGYEVQLTNQIDTLSLQNTCYYPNPSMNSLPAGMCLAANSIALTGSGGGALGIGKFDILDADNQQLMVSNATEFDPGTVGPGTFEVRYTFDEIPNQAPCMNCSPGAIQTISQTIEVSAGTETLVCNDQINISLDATCSAEITPDMILEGTYASYAVFSVEIYDGPNNIGNLITGEYVDEILEVKVVNTCNGESCWGTILVNDKLGPVIDCPEEPILLSCALEAEDLLPPAVQDNCEGPVVPFLVDEIVEEFGCDGDELLMTRIIQIWGAADSHGNEAETCTRILEFTKSDLSQVVAPLDLDNDEAPALDCAANPSLDPSQTGFPTVDGVPISLDEGLCSFTANYVDSDLPGCGNSTHILRTWTVFDWCAPSVAGENPLIIDQVIKVMDLSPPSIDCPASITLIAGNTDCTATDLLPEVFVQDDCSEFSVSILTPYGVISGNGGAISDLAPGTYTIEYQATDACGNVGACEVELIVQDLVAPVVVCDEFTVVDLESSGTAQVLAEVFDDGSYDFCTSVSFLARRMNSNDAFAESVLFTCEDVANSPIQVVMQATDEAGNSNTCMVWVTVQDKLPPQLVCPENITLDCQEDYTDLNVTGTVSVTENCDFALEIATNDAGLDQLCSVGTVIRTFTVTDASGNSASCSQTITIENTHPFDGNTILWPADYEASFCDSMVQLHPDSLPTTPINYGRPIYTEPTCGLIAWSYEDEVFDISGPACFKIVRTWRIIDWCQFDPVNPIGEGIWEHEQVIKVVDNTPPYVECVFDPFVKLNTPDCFGTVVLEMPDSIYDCSPNITIEANSDLGVGFGPFENVPVGNYNVTYTITDQCGNATVCSYVLQVVDAKPPTPICVNGYVIEIDVDGAVTLSASDFNSSSNDNCTPADDLIFSFSSNWNDTTRTFGCDEVGLQEIALYVFDEAYNFDFCLVPLIVQDNFYSCLGPFPISGGIATETAEPLEGAEVAANGPSFSSTLTDNLGAYTLEDLNGGDDYSIAPAKDDDLTNGVTTYDVVLLTRYILGLDQLDSPYKIIAADVNHSGSVTTLDVVALQAAILGIADHFPNNTSWRFADANHSFSDPLNPLGTGFPEILNFNNLADPVVNANFVAIKVGDLNGTAQANAMMQPENRSAVAEGHLFWQNGRKVLQLKPGAPIVAWQLAFDCSGPIENLEISDPNVQWHYLAAQQQLRLIWAAPDGKPQADEIAISSDASLDLILDLDPAFSRIYDLSGKAGSWKWTDQPTSSRMELIPNPMQQYTRVTIWGAVAEGTLEVRSLEGSLLFQQKQTLAAGQHTVELERAIFPTTGIYLVVFATEDEVITKRISVIR